MNNKNTVWLGFRYYISFVEFQHLFLNCLGFVNILLKYQVTITFFPSHRNAILMWYICGLNWVMTYYKQCPNLYTNTNYLAIFFLGKIISEKKIIFPGHLFKGTSHIHLNTYLSSWLKEFSLNNFHSKLKSTFLSWI